MRGNRIIVVLLCTLSLVCAATVDARRRRGDQSIAGQRLAAAATRTRDKLFGGMQNVARFWSRHGKSADHSAGDESDRFGWDSAAVELGFKEFMRKGAAEEDVRRDPDDFLEGMTEEAWEEIVALAGGDMPTLEEFRLAREEELEFEAEKDEDDEAFWLGVEAAEQDMDARGLEDDEDTPSLTQFYLQRKAFLEANRAPKPPPKPKPTNPNPCKPGRTAVYNTTKYYIGKKSVSLATCNDNPSTCTLRKVEETKCLCPIDYTGSRCRGTREFRCTVSPVPAIPESCLKFAENEAMDHKLSGDPPCFIRSHHDIFNFSVMLDCEYVTKPTSAEMAPNITLGTYSTIFDNTFNYWLSYDDKLFFTKNPKGRLRWKAFNFEHLGDNSGERYVSLKQSQWAGSSTVDWFVNLTDIVDNRAFAAGDRSYFEVGIARWANVRGMNRHPVPIRSFIDYTDIPRPGPEEQMFEIEDLSSLQVLAIIAGTLLILIVSAMSLYRLSAASGSRGRRKLK